jgi:catechol 2,3-dioxygenase-like lactoylglutathione lyase family enzyme
MLNVRHVGIVVRDLGLMRQFYCEALGFSEKGETKEEGSFISSILGVPQSRIETLKIAPQDNKTRIEFVCWKNPPARFEEKKALSSAGLTHIALTVKNLDEIHQYLVRKELRFNGKGPQLDPSGRLKVLFCQDPEGNWLELIEEIQ